MKTIAAAVAFCILIGQYTFGEEFEKGFELVGAGSFFFPDDDFYDEGYSVNAQGRYWFHEHFGLSLGAGYGMVDVDESSDTTVSVTPDLFGLTNVESHSGDITTIPLGGSILFRTALGKTFTVTVEGGVYYVIVDSDIDTREDFTVEDLIFGGTLSAVDNGTIDVDDGIVGVVAADINCAVNDKVTLFAGGGYQFDIDEGDVEFKANSGDLILGLDVPSESTLEGFFVRIGAIIAL